MADFLKRPANNEKGAASVLVVFMMMVLVTLGAFAITSANANYKLSQRSLEWNAMYYDLDAKGEEFLAALDARLAKAESMARDYMENKGYLAAEQPGIPEQIQAGIFAGYAGGEFGIGEIFGKIYMHYADIYIEELTAELPGLQAYPSENGPFVDFILAEISVVSERPGQELCGLNISVWVEPVQYEASEAGGLVRANDDLRYKIEDWYEYQEPINEEPEIELWDGGLDEGPAPGLWDGGLDGESAN